MDIISALNGITRYTPASGFLLDKPLANQALAHVIAQPKTVIRTLNITLHPRHHKTEPKSIRKQIIDLTKNFICSLSNKHEFYAELHWEFQESGVIHAHGLIAGRITHIGTILSRYRSGFGFVKSVTPNDLIGWRAYYMEPSDKKPIEGVDVNVYKPNRFYTGKLNHIL